MSLFWKDEDHTTTEEDQPTTDEDPDDAEDTCTDADEAAEHNINGNNSLLSLEVRAV